MLPRADTIAAIASPVGSGGVGIIRISGPEALEVLSRAVEVAPDSLEPRKLRYGNVRRDGEVLDEVLFVAMPGPSSFTGEDIAEIHGHGGAANMARLLRRVLEVGARHAEAGEFTRRAFENGRLDLTRAEAIADIINASSERALRVAQEQLRGSLSKEVAALRATAVLRLAETEAQIDFPEDDLDEEHLDAQKKAWLDLAQKCGDLASTFRTGRAISQGISIALCGEVNAGKSSLFNALVGTERALVAEDAGTTRDYVEGRVIWDGVEVTLIDTAGHRQAESEVERRGIELGKERALDADLEILLVPPGEEAPKASQRQLVLRSKADLASSEGLGASAKTGAGIAELKRAVLDRVLGVDREMDEGRMVTSERQNERLLRAEACLRRAAEGLKQLPMEVVSVELRQACDALAEITGEIVGEEMLDALFARFCIGK